MSIFQYLEERKSQKKFEEEHSEAIRMFDEQKAAIKAIANTAGYGEIVKFFEREREAALQRMLTAKGEEGKELYRLSSSFLFFLDKLSK